MSEGMKQFFHERDGRYFLKLGPLIRASVSPGPERLMSLRREIHLDRLQSLGFKGDSNSISRIGDDVLAAAAISGLVSNPAFLDIVDDQLVRAACFCCYYTRSHRRAVEVANQLQTILRYYSQESYLSSNAFLRVICSLTRDLYPAEERQVQDHIRRGQRDPFDADSQLPRFRVQMRDKVYRLSREAGLPALHSDHLFGPCTKSCLPVSFWLYSSQNTRRFIRCLSRAAKAHGLTITVAIATSSVFALRFKHRVYALSCFTAAEDEKNTEAIEDFGREENLKRFWRLVEKTLKRFASRSGSTAPRSTGAATRATKSPPNRRITAKQGQKSGAANRRKRGAAGATRPKRGLRRPTAEASRRSY